MTFEQALETLKAGREVRRESWHPLQHLSMTKTGHILMHMGDGREGLWVYTQDELTHGDWEAYGNE